VAQSIPGRRAARRLAGAVLAGLLLAPLAAAENQQGPELRRDPAASAKTPSRIPRTSSTLEIDGKLDEPAWSDALVIELPYEVWPGDNIEAPVRTEALLLYDDARLYVGFRAFDSEPHKIRARLSDRDRAFQDDFVGIVVDTFNDERRAFEFFVNAFGVQMDLVQDDVSGREDSSWDAIWDSGGHVNGDGYETEMAIPYTSLRFQRGAGDQVWGLDVIRIWPRDQRRTLASNLRDRDVSCYLCQVSKVVGFEGATPGKNLEITPTLVAGNTEAMPADDFPDGSLDSTSEEDLGLTVRWGFTPNLTLSGTVNPDFSQVEADVARLNVNEAFALFFPEKRPFFLEGADFFDTPIQAVYTRTVAEPEWGTKVTGKEGKHAIGGFVARDEPDNGKLLVPGSEGSAFVDLEGAVDDMVLRYRSDVGKSSAIGGLMTAREGQDGYHNRVAGFDTLIRPTDKDNIRFQFLGSQTRYSGSVLSRLDPDEFGHFADSVDDYAMRLNYSHRTKDYGARFTYMDFGEDFRSDLGFIPRVDYRMAIAGGWYTWWQEPESKWAWFEIGGDWDQTEDQSGNLLEREYEVTFLASGPKQSFFFFGTGFRDKTFNKVEFEQSFVNLFAEASPARDLSLWVELNFSDREDVAFFDPDPLVPNGGARQGDEIRAAGNIRYNFGRHLRTDLRHNYQTLDIDGGEAFRANLTELRVVYQFNVRMFARAIVQYLDVERNLSLYPECGTQAGCNLEPEQENLFGQFLFSYKLNPQTAIFAGYTENQFGLQGTGLITTEKTFFLKLGYAWVM
jgi:hypothetical protein